MLEGQSSQYLPLYKAIILYLLYRTEKPLSRARIMDFVLGRGYTNFINFQEAVGDLLTQGLIAEDDVQKRPNRTYLRITSTGEDTLRYYRDRIGSGVIKDIDAWLDEMRLDIRNDASVRADYSLLAGGACEVRLTLAEGDRTLASITMEAPDTAFARHACERWEAENEAVYAFLLEKLFADGHKNDLSENTPENASEND